MITIRPTTPEDIPTLLEIFQAARAFMAANGNPTQWVNRPTAADIERDISKGNSYVCIEDGAIAGTFAYIPGPDPTYKLIENGQWPDEEPYGVIHRLAGSKGHRGVAQAAIQWAFEQCERLRLDTHENNHVLQAVLKQEGFLHCGTIYVEDGTPRWAYFKHQTSEQGQNYKKTIQTAGNAQ